jgi:hypothetical protein
VEAGRELMAYKRICLFPRFVVARKRLLNEYQGGVERGHLVGSVSCHDGLAHKLLHVENVDKEDRQTRLESNVDRDTVKVFVIDL